MSKSDALIDIKLTRLKLQDLVKFLESKKGKYDWGGQRVIDDILLTLDSPIEQLKIFEENRGARYG
jgi:hypothetical protein